MRKTKKVLLAAVLSSCFGLVSAEDANPFAKWDRLSRTTDIEASPAQGSRSAESKEKPKTGATSLEYFSPKSDSPSDKPDSETVAEKPATRSERLQVRSAQEKSAVTVDKKTTTPESRRAPQTAAAAGKTSIPDFDSIESAAFVEVPQKPVIRQISGASTEGEDANPFAEFLMPQEAAVAAPDFDDAALNPEMLNENQELSLGTSGDLGKGLSGPQTPSVTLQWVHHSDFNIGQPCDCDLIVENTGRASVRNVVTEAVLPEGLEVITAEPAPTATGASATWTFGELAPGQKRVIHLTVVPRKQGNLQMDAFVRLTGASSSSVVVRQPRIAIELQGPQSVEVGQQVNYTVQVSNPGTGAARNVVIQAAIPDGLEHRHGSLLSIDIGTLSPGENRQARLSLTGVRGGEHSLAVRVVADAGLSEQTMETVSIAEPRLNIGIRGPADRMTGQNGDYELIVVNEGKVQSNNVRAKYRVPEGFEFVAADRGGKFNTEDGTIDWFVGTLDPNQVSHFKVTLRPTGTGTSVHQVGVLSEHGQLTMAEHQTEVTGNANLELKIAANHQQVKAGEETVFEIRISNTGASTAENVGVSCELPSGLELLQVSGPSEYVADSGVMVFRSMPTLAPGKSAIFAIRTRCVRSGNHRVRARVASDSIREPLIGEETAVGTGP
ncbi:MAG: DUF11 domain-containing protein [Planctomycetaceae bacterium]|nr:DUF11 domain-containing protein [Planctomycetaceae bacterium]